VDDSLDGRYDEEAKLVLWLGLMCRQSRPTMRQVCQYLDGEADVQEDAVLVFSDVDFFGSRAGVPYVVVLQYSVSWFTAGRRPLIASS
jgi:hypothetical protein